jgi:Mn-dependent DtxR family transcriptional regulator
MTLSDEIVSSEGQTDGISPVDLLELPPLLGAIVQKVMRKNGLRSSDLAAELNQAADQVQQALNELVAKGYLQCVEINQEIWYRAHFKQKAKRKVSDIWSALDEKH